MSRDSFGTATPEVRSAIADLVLNYCRAIDRRDFELLSDLYHPDAQEDHGPMFCGPADEFIRCLPKIMAPIEMTMHYVVNMLIRCSGDRAEGEIYTIAVHRMRAAEGEEAQFLVGGGRYLDVYERCQDDRWRFARRKIVADFEWQLPAHMAPLLEGIDRGKASASDPSYAFLRLFGRGVL